MSTSNRTERSLTIEKAIRAGASVDAACQSVDPPAFAREVYRIRRDHCGDMKFERARRAMGANHLTVVRRMKEAAEKKETLVLADIAREIGVTRARVVQIVENARKWGDLPPATSVLDQPPPSPEPPA